jgi:hypothetical protein
MDLLSKYDFDVFVSYAHVDNEPIYPVERGWVSTLVETLNGYAAQKIGRRELFAPWYDRYDFKGNHSVQDIFQQVKRSALFLAILSPGYVTSEACLRELEAFIESHRDSLSERLFIVDRLPLGVEHKLPEAFRDLRKYRFYKYDQNRIPRTFAQPTPQPDEREYYQLVDDIARDIASELSSIKRPKTSKPAVLLAEVTDDLESKRDEVRRYLDQAGIEVRPTGAYRLVRDEFERSLSADLSDCALFVQLLGPIAGKRPPDVPRGFGWLQFELAKQRKLQILQWRDLNFEVSSVESPLQLELLNADTVCASPFEDFKRSIVDSYRQIVESPPPFAPTRLFGVESSSMVFINADPIDRESADAIKERLGDHVGSAVPLSLYAGDVRAEELQADMERNLMESDGLLIVYGAARPAWVTGQLQLYRKFAPRRTRQLRFIAVVEAPPAPKAPISVRLPGMMTIDIDAVAQVVNSRLGL